MEQRNAQHVSAPTIMILSITESKFHGLNWFNYRYENLVELLSHLSIMYNELFLSCICCLLVMPSEYLWFYALLTSSLKGKIVLRGRVFADSPGDLVSIPGRVIPKTLKMVLDTSLLNTRQYKVCIKGKVEQLRERSSALPDTSVL